MKHDRAEIIRFVIKNIEITLYSMNKKKFTGKK